MMQLETVTQYFSLLSFILGIAAGLAVARVALSPSEQDRHKEQLAQAIVEASMIWEQRFRHYWTGRQTASRHGDAYYNYTAASLRLQHAIAQFRQHIDAAPPRKPMGHEETHV